MNSEKLLYLPNTALHTDRLVNTAQLLQLAVANGDLVFPEKGNVGHVFRPHHVLDFRHIQRCHRTLLLHVEQRHLQTTHAWYTVRYLDAVKDKHNKNTD